MDLGALKEGAKDDVGTLTDTTSSTWKRSLSFYRTSPNLVKPTSQILLSFRWASPVSTSKNRCSLLRWHDRPPDTGECQILALPLIRRPSCSSFQDERLPFPVSNRQE